MPILNIIGIITVLFLLGYIIWWDINHGVSKLRSEIMEKVNKIDNETKK